jgi:hypothetical protein
MLIAGGVGAVGVTTFLLLAHLEGYRGGLSYYLVDFPEVAFLSGTWSAFHPARAARSAVILLGVAGLVLTIRRRRVVATVLVGLTLFSATATTVIAREVVQVPSDQTYGRQASLIRDAAAGPGDVVYASTELPWSLLVVQQREVSWAKVVRFDPRVRSRVDQKFDPDFQRFAAIPADATLYIAPWSTDEETIEEHTVPGMGAPFWDGTAYGWQIAVYDAEDSWAAWRRD